MPARKPDTIYILENILRVAKETYADKVLIRYIEAYISRLKEKQG